MEVAEVVQGQSPPGDTYNSSGQGLPFFQGKAEFGLLHPVPSKWCSEPRKIAEPGDILISIRAPVGPTNLADVRCCIGRGLAAIRPRGGILARFLDYYLKHSVSLLTEQATGTTFDAIGGAQLRTHPVLLPPLREQVHIVQALESFFTRLDDAEATLERVKRNLKRCRASILRAAIEGRLTLVRGTALASDNSALPPGWSRVQVREIGKVQLGRQRSPKDHSGPNMRPYLRVANVFEDRIDTSNVKEMNFRPDEFETFRLEDGDILLNEGQSLELVGRPAMFRGEVPGACFQNTLVRFRAGPRVIREFALIVFRAYLHDGSFQRIARWTTNIAHLGSERFAAMAFPLPPLEVQRGIVREVDDLLSVCDRAERTVTVNTARSQRLRQGVLAMAFDGSLVDHDPKDEPASVLVERIRASQVKAASALEKPHRRGHPRKAV
jgi:type I restriction enzyme S subunit